MKPTKERNPAAVLISYAGEGILMDCGEGTQRQFRAIDMKPTKVTKILITHWHGDHVLGLPGLLQTIGSEDRPKTIEIYGPRGTKKFFENMAHSFYFDRVLDMKIVEVENGRFFENESFALEAMELEHNVPTLGYAFVEKDRRRISVPFVKKLGIPDGPLLGKLQMGKDIEWKGKKVTAEEATSIVKGKKIAYITDTAICKNCITLAQDADLLISESVYEEGLHEKASQYKHMTAVQAASIANTANVKKLVLTHFSQRYKTTEKVQEEAKAHFSNVLCAYDFLKVKV